MTLATARIHRLALVNHHQKGFSPAFIINQKGHL